MKSFLFLILFLVSSLLYAQTLPPKQAYPIDILQIHSGHSLTDPLFGQPWPGQFVRLMEIENGAAYGSFAGDVIAQSTIPGSSMSWRWDNPPGFGAPDARHDIEDWELLCITERVPLYYEGGGTEQWYLDNIQEQRDYLLLFMENAWENGNDGNGTPTLLWTTWTNIDDSDGPWRSMLDTQGEEFERMQDYVNDNLPSGAPHVYLIPGHRMMARIYDDIQLGVVPDITDIADFFEDNIHTNTLGDYAIAMIHYACIFNESPVGLPNELIDNPQPGDEIPSTDLALYLQTIVWEEVTSYFRTGITDPSLATENLDHEKGLKIYPNPAVSSINLTYDSNSTKETVLVYDYLGNIVFKGNTKKVDVEDFPSGMYIVKVGEKTAKFVKE